MSERNPDTHAALDLASRRKKAAKIQQLIQRQIGEETGPIRLLEIGTGSGVIASVLASSLPAGSEVHGVDVVDQRVVSDGYWFTQVAGTKLPFDDEYFDIVVSNHVIEHVGDWHDQRHHLEEIRRVLKQEGWLYLAFPQKWGPYEPHYGIPLLSWFPSPVADWLVRRASGRTRYDCLLPSRTGINELFRSTGFRANEVTLDALDVMIRSEFDPAYARILSFVPRTIWRMALPIFPTLVFFCQKHGIADR